MSNKVLGGVKSHVSIEASILAELKSEKQVDVDRALITKMSQRMKVRSCIRLRHEKRFAKNAKNDDNDCD